MTTPLPTTSRRRINVEDLPETQEDRRDALTSSQHEFAEFMNGMSIDITVYVANEKLISYNTASGALCSRVFWPLGRLTT